MLPDLGASGEAWASVAAALSDAGRNSIVLEWRRGADTFGTDALVSDLHAVLHQLSSRPVIIANGSAAYIAAVALGEGGPDLASGLALVETIPGGGSTSAASADLAERAAAAIAETGCPILLLAHGEDFFPAARETQHIECSAAAPSPEVPDRRDAFHACLIDFLERRAPRTATEYVAGSDPRTLRDALGTFATGVTIVTATAPDGRHIGLTANSFTSVSLEPPLLLVCPARSAGSMPVLEKAEFFAVNVLHIGQQGVSNLFAAKGEDRFAETEFELWDRGVPILANALASFECRKYAEYDGGDHVILVGEVERVRYAPQRDPLLYFRGKYRRLHFA
ncbi:flavin reductase family protein [Qipengyuania atrilutea]|uniref:flavin reductase family protein n=1 Tax=Qipengyuania atrilutea TaxID=2744473 RepID=UPI001CEC4995|nr:flavin reductase family protein [Actirhodobacter atriluteus]